jgi:hypothetical protein
MVPHAVLLVHLHQIIARRELTVVTAQVLVRTDQPERKAQPAEANKANAHVTAMVANALAEVAVQ